MVKKKSFSETSLVNMNLVINTIVTATAYKKVFLRARFFFKVISMLNKLMIVRTNKCQQNASREEEQKAAKEKAR